MTIVVRATAGAFALILAGCGSSSHSQSTKTATNRPAPVHRRASVLAGPLRATGSLTLPAARSGIAASVFGGRIIVSGGLDNAGVSTDTVLAIDSAGRASTLSILPTPVHDAASAVLAGRLVLFGGGPTEGSDRIVQVRPGAPRLLGNLPQPLSDLTSTTIGSTVYIVGGWNGTDTNRYIYAVSPAGSVSPRASIPQGVRYPAA